MEISIPRYPFLTVPIPCFSMRVISSLSVRYPGGVVSCSVSLTCYKVQSFLFQPYTTEFNLFHIPGLTLIPFYTGLHSMYFLPGVHGSESRGSGCGTRPVEPFTTDTQVHFCQTIPALWHQLRSEHSVCRGGRREGGRNKLTVARK